MLKAFKPKPGFGDEQLIEFEEYLEQSSDLIYPVDLVDWRTAPLSDLNQKMTVRNPNRYPNRTRAKRHDQSNCAKGAIAVDTPASLKFQ